MEPLYTKEFHISPVTTDRYSRLKISQLLGCLQDVAGDHSAILGTDRNALMDKNLFWAVIRHRVQITRLPESGEILRVETWPMPTTRTAYPRSTIAYDENGNECFRSISLWILMDAQTRAMVLPGKSGVQVDGLLRGCELQAPGSMLPKEMHVCDSRTVRYTDLDVNGHMNNCRYMQWVDDLLDADFHEAHSPKELLVCYLSEARESEKIDITWEVSQETVLRVDAQRKEEGSSVGHSRVFAAQVQF